MGNGKDEFGFNNIVIDAQYLDHRIFEVDGFAPGVQQWEFILKDLTLINGQRGDECVTCGDEWEDRPSWADGGCLLSSGGEVYIEGVTFENCTALDDGGAIANEDGSNYVTDPDPAGIMFIKKSLFIRNRAFNDGGAIKTEDWGRLWVSGTNFKQNWAGDDGGAIANDDGWVDIIKSKFEMNVADDQGGALFNNDEGGSKISSMELRLGIVKMNMCYGDEYGDNGPRPPAQRINCGGGFYDETCDRLVLHDIIATGNEPFLGYRECDWH